MTMMAKQHYSIGEIYSLTLEAVRTRRFLADSRAGRDKQFAERIILAVAEVNGCALCSYGHSRLASGQA